MGACIFELSEGEMRQLAEMSAMTLTMLAQAMPDQSHPRVAAWQNFCINVLEEARKIPSLARDMELNPECGYWFFKRSYVEEAFYSDVLDEYRDSSFWEEVVSRVAEQALERKLGSPRVAAMSESERERRLSSMEKALWHEVSRHGVERLGFMLPSEES